jgi:hypothetical protein
MVVEVLEAPTLRRSCRREAGTTTINGTNSKELNHFQPLMQKAGERGMMLVLARASGW